MGFDGDVAADGRHQEVGGFVVEECEGLVGQVPVVGVLDVDTADDGVRQRVLVKIIELNYWN